MVYDGCRFTMNASEQWFTFIVCFLHSNEYPKGTNEFAKDGSMHMPEKRSARYHSTPDIDEHSTQRFSSAGRISVSRSGLLRLLAIAH